MMTKNPLYFPVLPFSCGGEYGQNADGYLVYKLDFECLHDAFTLYRHISRSIDSMPVEAICDYIAAKADTTARRYWRSLKKDCKLLPYSTLKFTKDVDDVIAFVNVLQGLTEKRRRFHYWWPVEIEEEWFAYLNELRLCNR